METTKEKLTQDQKDILLEISVKLDSRDTFKWELTSSGEEYWGEVHRKILDLIMQKEESTSTKIPSKLSIENRLKRIEKKLGIKD